MKSSNDLKDELKAKRAQKLKETFESKDNNIETEPLKDKQEVIEQIIEEKKQELKQVEKIEKCKKKESKKVKEPVEEKIEVIEDKPKVDDKQVIEKKPHKGLIIPFVLLGTLSFIAYFIYQILQVDSILSILPNLIGGSLISLFMLCFMLTSIKNNNTKATPFIIIGSLLLIGYSSFSFLYQFNYINLPKENTVLSFYNQTITYANQWGKENGIDIEEIYEYSDIVPEYTIISQNILEGTLTSKINKIVLVISKGPDYSKEVIIPSFVSWNFDDVISYLENNFLNNVDISFVNSNNKANTVISQKGSGTMRRSDLITLQFAQGTIEETKIIDFTNKSKLYSTSWLKMKGFNYEIAYENSDNIKKDYVIKQDIKNEVKDPLNDTIKLTISKGRMIVIPNINDMTQEELNAWIMSNGLKINYNEVYNEEVANGDIIESDQDKGDILEVGDTINVTVSKGRLEMIKITSLTDFYLWADQNKVDYKVEYEFNNTIKKDDIIKASHNTGDIIKTNDTVVIYVSQGKSITLPNFVGMGKNAINEKCNTLNLSCSFSYGGYTETTNRDIALKQSKKSGVVVAEGTNLVITLSSGIFEKVSIPNYIGKTKTEITKSCNSVGLNCKFVYEKTFSSTKKDIATKQSLSGKVNKGSSITITLSKGPARTYNVVIQGDQLTAGNPEATKKTLQSKLSSACPGVTFTYSFQTANSGIGYLASSSQVKVGNNTFVEGKTYKVIINSN